MARTSLLAATLVLITFAANSQLAGAQDSRFPAKANPEKLLQSLRLRATILKNPFKAETGRNFAHPASKIPHITLTPLSAPPDLCSVPLLQVNPPPGKWFAIMGAPAEGTDRAMAVRPPAPSCGKAR